MSTKLTLDGSIWTDDNKLRNVFSWLTRLGVAPRFGSLPICYYQQDQCNAIKRLEDLAKAKGIDLTGAPVRNRMGWFEAKTAQGWKRFAQILCYQIQPA